MQHYLVNTDRDRKDAQKCSAQKEADKERRTLSWYIESLVEEIAKKKKIAA